MPQLDGPARQPPASRRPGTIVVALHGYGADGEDLIDLAPAIQQALPDALVLAPHAPFPCEIAPFGRQWFSIEGASAERRLAEARAVAPQIDAYLDEALAEHGLTNADLVLVGFSQGTMMALHVGLRRREPPVAIVGFSGRLLGADVLASEICARPPVLLVHGAEDPVVPVENLDLTADALEASAVTVERHVRPGLGHGIDSGGLALATDFLARIRADS